MNANANNTCMVNRVETSAGNLVRMLSPAITLGLTNHNSNSSNHDDFSVSGTKKPFLIGVSGGTASGKTSVCRKLLEAVEGSDVNNKDDRKMITLSQDSFYKELTPANREMARKGLYNFDHPDAFDHDLMLACLDDVRAGRTTKIPHYDFITHSRLKDKFTIIQPSDVVLVEGILVFYDKDMMEMFDMKLFVDTDADTRLARRVLRDIQERGRDLAGVLQQYTKFVKPAFEEFCLPTKKHADVIIPRGKENLVAISVVARHIKDIIYKRNKCCSCTDKSGTFN